VDLRDGGPSQSVQPLGQLVDYIESPMVPAALVLGLGVDLVQRRPEPQPAITDCQQGRLGEPPSLQVSQQLHPGVGTLPVALLHRQQLLVPVGPSSQHHQRSGNLKIDRVMMEVSFGSRWCRWDAAESRAGASVHRLVWAPSARCKEWQRIGSAS
jgi:hypothetical protein